MKKPLIDPSNMSKDKDFRDYVISESVGSSVAPVTPIKDVDPNDITLGSIVTITQDAGGDHRAFDFEVCAVWNNPRHVFSIVNVSKEKIEANAWIMFYSTNAWFIRKCLKGTANVHVQLKA